MPFALCVLPTPLKPSQKKQLLTTSLGHGFTVHPSENMNRPPQSSTLTSHSTLPPPSFSPFSPPQHTPHSPILLHPLGFAQQTTSAPSLSIPHYPYADFSHPHPTTSSSLQQLNTRSGQNSYFSSQHHQSPLTFLRLTSSPAQLNFVPLHLAASYSRHGHASLASSPNLNPPPPF